MTKKAWGKLGFVPPVLPWEQPGADLIDATVFGGAAHQAGVQFALKMWEHYSVYNAILRDHPDDGEAQLMILDYLRSLDSKDATEFVVFNRSARATAVAMVNRRMKGKVGGCRTYGLLPFGQPIDPRPIVEQRGDIREEAR